MISTTTLRGNMSGTIDWVNIGPAHYPKYKASVSSTAQNSTVTNTLCATGGTFPGASDLHGGVLMTDGRVFCVPRNGTAGRTYGLAGSRYAQDVLLSAYYNNF